jgi:hypothetical protein
MISFSVAPVWAASVPPVWRRSCRCSSGFAPEALSLWLVGRLHGRDHARAVRKAIQYEPAPPYLADEPC